MGILFPVLKQHCFDLLVLDGSERDELQQLLEANDSRSSGVH